MAESTIPMPEPEPEPEPEPMHSNSPKVDEDSKIFVIFGSVSECIGLYLFDTNSDAVEKIAV
jgi:hypothetical protein